MENDFDFLKPILVVENICAGQNSDESLNKNNDQKISQSEEILLTLIAEIIVEIVLKEEL